jgi:hypothetical protein
VVRPLRIRTCIITATTRLSADFDRGCGEFTAGGARLTTLALFSLFTVFNARSDKRSACIGLLSNKWLWASVGFSLLLLATVMARANHRAAG